MSCSRKICVAFDLDDTLFKEYYYVRSGWRAIAEEFAPLTAMDSESLYRQMAEAPDALDAVLDLPEIAGAGITIDDLLAVYRAHRPTLQLPSETLEALRALGGGGASLAIITDGRSITQRNKIEALGLDAIIPACNIIISGEVGADKLTEHPFRELMRRQPADRYYMVGDNPIKDFYYPNLLGWTSIMLRDREGINVPSQDLSVIEAPYWPQIFIDKLTQLPTLCLPH